MQGIRHLGKEEEELRKERRQFREEEELRQKRKLLRKEEDEEDKEISMYYQRLGYMLEGCSENDRSICGLIEEQQGLLNTLCMSKRDFLDEVDICMNLL